MAWTWEETTPGSTIGSMRARPTRPGHSMRQKALALPARPTEAATTDFFSMMSSVFVDQTRIDFERSATTRRGCLEREKNECQ